MEHDELKSTFAILILPKYLTWVITLKEISYHWNVRIQWSFQGRIIYLIVIKKGQSVLGFGISNPIAFIRHGESINKFCLCFLFCDFLKLTNTLMPKQAQRIDIILPFYPNSTLLFLFKTDVLLGKKTIQRLQCRKANGKCDWTNSALD